MARGQAQKSNNEKDSLAESIANRPMPSKYRRVNAASGKRLFIKPSENLVVEGLLLGRFRRGDKKGYFYQIQVSKPVVAFDKDKNEVEVAPGQTVTVDERTAMQDLINVAEKPNQHEVYIHFVEKVPLDNGQDFWRTEIGACPAEDPAEV